MAQTFDIAIAGGGLSGGLIALALAARRPELSIALVEAEDRIGGNHLWSFFETDVAPENRGLLDPLIAARWDDGYRVIFPEYSRDLGTPYRSVTSERLDAVVRAALPEGHVRSGTLVEDLSSGELILPGGERIQARGVIDARGISRGDAVLRSLSGGWQKFVGRMLRTREPHGLDRPIVMDASVAQHDGYRFVYSLPFGPNEVFVEDTYYSDTPDLDRGELAMRIAHYARAQGWEVVDVSREEAGVLPVVTGGDFDTLWAAGVPGVGRAGVRAGLFQPMTSYSFPDAVRFAAMIAALPALDSASLTRASRAHARAHWRRTRFYRLLGTMLFGASPPDDRYRVLQRFYGLDAELIERFYAGQGTTRDAMRILSGKPPVPIHRAALVLAGVGAPGRLETDR